MKLMVKSRDYTSSIEWDVENNLCKIDAGGIKMECSVHKLHILAEGVFSSPDTPMTKECTNTEMLQTAVSVWHFTRWALDRRRNMYDLVNSKQRDGIVSAENILLIPDSMTQAMLGSEWSRAFDYRLVYKLFWEEDGEKSFLFFRPYTTLVMEIPGSDVTWVEELKARFVAQNKNFSGACPQCKGTGKVYQDDLDMEINCIRCCGSGRTT